MTVETGYFTGQSNMVQKEFTKQHTFDNVVLKESTSVQKPVILIQASTDKGEADILKSTYVHIPDFNRYYFVIEAKSERNHLVRVLLESDPLKSFESKIYKNKCMVKRTASKKQSAYLQDNKIPVYADSKVFTRPLSPVKDIEFDGAQTTVFSDTPSYVMITAGPSGAV